MDKLRAMAAFVHIVDAGSLTAAADALGTSPTSVVRTLAALEAALGVRLLNRSTRRIALTDEGREYLERSRRILAEVDEAEATLSARQTQPAGRLAVTAPVMFGRLHVAPEVTDFIAAHPEVQVDLLLLDRVVDLLDEGMDLAVRIGPLPDSSLVARPVGETRRVVCASPAYLAKHGEPRHARELAGHDCLRVTGLDAGPEWIFEHQGRPLRVPVHGPLMTNQVEAALEACAKGLGCGRFLGYQAAALLSERRLVRILQDFEPPPAPVHIVYPHSRLLSSRVRAFLDWTAPRLRKRLRDAV